MNERVHSLPDGWRWARLGEVCEVQLGKMLSPASRTGVRPRPYLRNANVQWGRFDLTDIAEMDFTAEQERKFLLRPGDLLVCEGGEPGRAAVWEGQIKCCLYQKALHRLRPKENAVDPRFVMYRLWLSSLAQEFIQSQAKTTIAHLPAIRLQGLAIAVPPLQEQKRIATILNEQMGAVERARAAAEAQLEAAKALPAAYIRESFDDSLTKQVSLGDALIEVSNGVGSSWEQYPVLGATRSGLAPAKEPVGKKPERYKLVNAGTIFYNPMRILLGSIAMIDDKDTVGVTSPDYVVFKGVSGVLHPRWFYHWLRSPQGDDFIKTLTRGAVRERLLFRRLARASVTLPSWGAQLEAAEQMKQIRPIRRKLEEDLDTINKLPAAFLRRAFSGEL